MARHDSIFDDHLDPVGVFQFDHNVAEAFDDMVQRSVPFYVEMHRMMAELANNFSAPSTSLYDLGCSTGKTLIEMDKYLEPSMVFYGLDESPDMLKMCQQNLKEAEVGHRYNLLQTDLNQGVVLENASIAVMCLTLQFIRPLYRAKLIRQIHQQLLPSGCLLLIEKVLSEDSIFNRLFIKYHYEYKKRNGYSDLSIAQKREALENILIPYKLHENLDLLVEVGFRNVEVFFKWYNFTGIVAVK